MNDEELGGAWTTLQPTVRQRRRIDARVSAWLEARDTPLAAEWLGLFRVAPFSAVGLVAVSAVSIVTATPLVWLARALLELSLRDGERRGCALRLDADQLDVEHQHAGRGARAPAVGERLGDPEPPLLALHHQLHAFGPAGDHLVRPNAIGSPRLTELSNILPSVVQPE